MKFWINKIDDPGMIIVAAFRYFIGRRTIATYSFATNLASNWHILPENVQIIIGKELMDAFKRDDEARARSDRYLPLGMDCDRQAWSRLLEVIIGHSAQNPAPNVTKRKLKRKEVRK